MNLSRRDKQLLLVLIGFLALAGIYQFGLEPLYLKLQQTRHQVIEKSAELAKIEVKVRRQQALTELRDELLLAAGELKAALNLELLDVPMPQRIKAVTALAQAGSTAINNLRPLAIIEPETGEKREGLIIEGETNSADFERFLSGLTGLHINELAMSRSDRKDRPLKFYLNGSVIPPDELALLTDIETVEPVIEPVEDVAAAAVSEEQPQLETPPEPELLLPPFDLSFLSLLGLFDDQAGRLAIVADRREGEDHFLRVGDELGEYRVVVIDPLGIELQNSAGERGRVEFPEDTQLFLPLTEVDQRGPIAEVVLPDELPKQQGRLGIRFKELTPALAKSKGLAVEKGLLILKGRDDVAEILPGDVLLSINGTAVGSFYGAKKALQEVAPGDAVELAVSGQDGRPKTVKVAALE